MGDDKQLDITNADLQPIAKRDASGQRFRRAIAPPSGVLCSDTIDIEILPVVLGSGPDDRHLAGRYIKMKTTYNGFPQYYKEEL